MVAAPGPVSSARNPYVGFVAPANPPAVNSKWILRRRIVGAARAAATASSTSSRMPHCSRRSANAARTGSGWALSGAMSTTAGSAIGSTEPSVSAAAAPAANARTTATVSGERLFMLRGPPGSPSVARKSSAPVRSPREERRSRERWLRGRLSARPLAGVLLVLQHAPGDLAGRGFGQRLGDLDARRRSRASRRGVDLLAGRAVLGPRTRTTGDRSTTIDLPSVRR